MICYLCDAKDASVIDGVPQCARCCGRAPAPAVEPMSLALQQWAAAPSVAAYHALPVFYWSGVTASTTASWDLSSSLSVP